MQAQRPAAPVQSSELRQSPWASYTGAGAGSIPEYQPSWTYPQQHSHSGWSASEHDAWKYSRGQHAAPPSGGVWQYPSQEYHEWGSRAQHGAQQPGYYYVSSGHPHEHQRAEEYIPYDIGARRAYQSPHMMPPPPPGYPLPPHMQYYSPASAPAQAPPQVSPPTVDVAGSPVKTGGAASFLFEAAAAAMAKSDKDASPSEKKEEVVDEESVSPKARRGRGEKAPPQRVNNHQLRLHATGNEKAPLATAGSSSGQITTLMIRNIPNRYSQTELMAEIKESGFDNKFDFFYLPMDHDTHANFGYAFINFVDEREVQPFTKRFNGLKLNRFTSNKIIQIVPAQLQGFQANLQHYCKKAVCTDDNIDYRPLFFVDGKCLEFHRASDFSDSVKGQSSPKAAPEPEAPRRRGAGKGVFQRKPRND